MEKIHYLEKKTLRKPLIKNTHLVELKDPSIFSYMTTKSLGTVVITQQETGFCICVEMEKIGEVLQINCFELTHTTDLEYLSIALFDAAIIEIVLKMVTELLTVAVAQNSIQIFFKLKEEDAKHLLSFEGLLGSHSILTMRDGQKTTFSLFTFPESQSIVGGKIAFIQSQVKQELWKSQRTDPYLKTYLQHHKKGERLSCLTVPTQTWDNVVMFPSTH